MKSAEVYAWTLIIRNLVTLITRCFGMIASNQVSIMDGKRPIYTENWFSDNENLVRDCGLSYKAVREIFERSES